MRVRALFPLLRVLAACSGEAIEQSANTEARRTTRLSQGIVNGTADTTAGDSVVYVAIGDQGSFCTGTLIAPNFVSTPRSRRTSAETTLRSSSSTARSRSREALSKVRLGKLTTGEIATTSGYGDDGSGNVTNGRFVKTGINVDAVGPSPFTNKTATGQALPVGRPRPNGRHDEQRRHQRRRGDGGRPHQKGEEDQRPHSERLRGVLGVAWRSPRLVDTFAARARARRRRGEPTTPTVGAALAAISRD